MDALRFEFAIADFDLGLLPVDASVLKGNPDLLRESIEGYLGDCFKRVGGEANIVARGDAVSVTWTPFAVSDFDNLKRHALALLKEGAAAQARPIIETLLKRGKPDSDLALNYGMVLSDLGYAADAAELLERLAKTEPGNASAWNALGVAYWKLERLDDAGLALERAYALAPGDGHVLKNHGALLLKKSPADALPILSEAVRLLPEDQSALYNLGLCLHRTGDFEKAFAFLRRAVDAAPYSALAETCRELLSQWSMENLRQEAPAGVKMDAVMYCLAALRGLAGMDETRRKSITAEIALLGRDGLDIAGSDKKYSLRTMPGRFSGLELLAWMFVGMKQLAPDADPGIDLRQEYALAFDLFKGRGGK